VALNSARDLMSAPLPSAVPANRSPVCHSSVPIVPLPSWPLSRC